MKVPRGAWLGLAALVVAAGLLLAPILPAPATRVLGNFQSEAATHAPALAAALEGLTRHGPFVLAEHPLHPGEINGAMYEPITTLVMWPVYRLAGGGAVGFTLAWNVWHLVLLVGGALGAWLWARAWLAERDPDGWGAGLAMALASASVFVHLSPEVGRTEAQNYPLYALHGGLLFRAVRRGGWAWVPAALSTVPVVWSGGYGTVFFAVVEPLVALWALSVAPDRGRAGRGLVGVAVVAVVAAAPLVWALRAYPYVGTGDALRQLSPSAALSVLVGGSDNLLRELPGYEVAPFAGFVLLAAALLSVTRGRAALWPLCIGLFVYGVAAGPAPTVGEGAMWGPAAVLAQVPGMDAVRGWSRIVAIAIPIFAVAAAALVAGGGRLRIAGAIVVSALALVEVARLPRGSWWSLEEPEELVALRAAGEVPIALPLDGLARVRRWVEPPARPDVWRVMPDRDLFKYFQDALPNEPELFRTPGAGPSGTYDPCELLADAVALRSLGFTTVYLRSSYLPHDGKGMAVRALKAVFGAPKEEGLWRIPEVIDPACVSGAPPAPIALGGEGKERSAPRTPEERERIRAERRAERERVRAERQRQVEERQAEERR